MSPKTAITIAIALLMLLLQWPLWFGKGSWWDARKLQSQLSSQELENSGKRERNARLASDVRDLQDGVVAAESQARQELGMIKGDEVFVQITPGAAKRPGLAASAMAPSPAKPTSAP